MADLSVIKLKIDALKSAVEQNSITPLYLGSLIDEVVEQIELIDMTDMADEIATAINTINAALQTAESALSLATSAKQVIDGKGQPDGIAPLDGEGKVPVVNMPFTMTDVSQSISGAVGTLQTAVTEQIGSAQTSATNQINTLASSINNRLNTLEQTHESDMESTAQAIETLATETTTAIDALDEQITGKLNTLDGEMTTAIENIDDRLDDTNGQLATLATNTTTAISASKSEAVTEAVETAAIYPFDGILETLSPIAPLSDDADTLSDDAEITPTAPVTPETPTESAEEVGANSDLPVYYDAAQNRFVRGAAMYAPYMQTVKLPGNMITHRPRTDRLYRCDNTLYRYDAETGALVALVDERLIERVDAVEAKADSAATESFKRQWLAMSANPVTYQGRSYIPTGYDSTTGEFIVNPNQGDGELRLTEAEAREVYAVSMSPVFPQMPASGAKAQIWPVVDRSQAGTMYKYWYQNANLEIIGHPIFKDFYYCPKMIASGGNPGMYTWFYQCKKLRHIYVPIDMTNFYGEHPQTAGKPFTDCWLLETVYLYKLNKSITLTSSPKLSLASLQYLVTNSPHKATDAAITVKVAAAVYAKLIGDETNSAVAEMNIELRGKWAQVLTDAIAKGITFST